MSEKKEFKKTKKDFTEFLKDKYVVKWIENYDSNRQARLSLLQDFTEFIGKTPTELILEHHKDKQQEPIEQEDIAKKQLFQFYNYLLEDKLVYKNTAIQYVFSKVLSFYAQNNVPIHLKKGEKPKMIKKGKRDKAMRKEVKDVNGEVKTVRIRDKKPEFKKIRDTLKTTRDRAILLVKLGSGLYDVDLSNITIGDYERGYFEEFKISYIEGNRQKGKKSGEGEYFQTFFNTESCEMVDVYLSERKQRGEKLNDNDYLFVSNKGIKDQKTEEIKYNKMKRTAFSDSLKKATKTLGIKNITPTYFRHWFNSTLKSNGIKHEIVERMMGHAGEISMDYEQIFNDDYEFAELYSKKINHLTILGNGNRVSKELKEDIDALKNVITEMSKNQTQKDNQMNELNAKFDALVFYMQQKGFDFLGEYKGIDEDKKAIFERNNNK